MNSVENILQRGRARASGRWESDLDSERIPLEEVDDVNQKVGLLRTALVLRKASRLKKRLGKGDGGGQLETSELEIFRSD